MAQRGGTKVIYKGTFISKQSLVTNSKALVMTINGVAKLEMAKNAI